MDFIPGRSLYKLVQKQGKLSEDRAIEYIKQIGSALVVCHKAGIIHRDAHPDNILIHADNGRAILIDFGISGTIQSERNTHAGNPAFAPWEQIAYWEKQNSKTPQVDIYTLAASLYYLVTGKIPTDCCSRKYNNSELIEPKQLNPNLSDTTNRAILKGMEVASRNRPNSMQKWLQLLDSTPDARYPNKKASISPPLKKSETSYQSQEASISPPSKKSEPFYQSQENKVRPSNVQEQIEIQKKEIEKNHRSLSRLFFKLIGAFFLGISLFSLIFPLILIIAINIKHPESEKNPNELIEKPENSQSQSEPTSPQYSTHSVIPVAFSPDNQIIASGSLDNTIRLHNSNSQNKKIATFKGHSDKIFSVAFSPNGKILASGSADNTIRLWNIETGREIITLEDHQEHIISVAFSPDGKILASGSADGAVKLYDVETGREIDTHTEHSNIVTSVAFSPDGRILASGSADSTVKLYDVATKETDTLPGHSDGVNSIAFSSDGRVLASGSDDAIKLWNVETKQEITTEGIQTVSGFEVEREVPNFSGGAESLVFSPHGMVLASSYHESFVTVFNFAKYKLKLKNNSSNPYYSKSVNKTIFFIL